MEKALLNQLDLLKASLKELDPDGCSENPFVLGLRQQIACAEKPRAENPLTLTAQRKSVPATPKI